MPSSPICKVVPVKKGLNFLFPFLRDAYIFCYLTLWRLIRLFTRCPLPAIHSESCGSITQISLSRGGIPKLPFKSAFCSPLGLRGDRQDSGLLETWGGHGGFDKALCLYSNDVIDFINGQPKNGASLFPGGCGENITIRGIPWKDVKPGIQMRLGDEVVIQVTSYTEPCQVQEMFFEDKDYFSRLSQDENPGFSRVYARVLNSGWLHQQDSVSID